MFIDDDYSWESRESVLENTQNRNALEMRILRIQVGAGIHNLRKSSNSDRNEKENYSEESFSSRAERR